MVDSKSYLYTTAVDRIKELNWQRVNWILVKPGEGGGSEHKLEGYNTHNICQKWEMCHFYDRHWCALTGDILFAKRWFHKTQAEGERASGIPCFIPVIVVNDNSSPMNCWMWVIKPAFITLCIPPSRHKHHICTWLDLIQVTFLPSSLKPVSLWEDSHFSLVSSGGGIHAVSQERREVFNLKALRTVPLLPA